MRSTRLPARSFSRRISAFRTSFTAIDPVTGEKAVNPAVLPEAGKAKLVCPGNFGARNWPATAAESGDEDSLRADDGDVLRLRLRAGRACADRKRRRGHALHRCVSRRAATASSDASPRSICRSVRSCGLIGSAFPSPVRRSRLRAALLFNSDLDRYFAAYDQANGKLLWRTRLGSTSRIDARRATRPTGASTLPWWREAEASSAPPVAGSYRNSPPPVPGITLMVFELLLTGGVQGARPSRRVVTRHGDAACPKRLCCRPNDGAAWRTHSGGSGVGPSSGRCYTALPLR